MIRDIIYRNISSLYTSYIVNDSIDINNASYKDDIIFIGKCLRNAYYSHMGFNNGLTSISDMLDKKAKNIIVNLLNEYITDIDIEVQLLDNKAIGIIDCIMNYNNENYAIYIHPISSKPYIANKVFAYNHNNPEPLKEDILKCLLLAHGTLNTIKKVILLYIKKDSGEIKEFEIEPAIIDNIVYPCINGAIDYSININNILKRIELLYIYTSSYTLPKKEYNKNKCMYCEYKMLCDKDGDVE